MTGQRLNKFLFSILQHMKQELLFSFRPQSPFCVCGISYDISLPREHEIQILMKGISVGHREVENTVPLSLKSSGQKSPEPAEKDDDDMLFHMEHAEKRLSPEPTAQPDDVPVNQNSSSETAVASLRLPASMVDITPLNNVPGAKIEHFLGRINFFLVRETVNLPEMHGIGNFTHVFLTEAKAIARSHVVALVRPSFFPFYFSGCV